MAAVADPEPATARPTLGASGSGMSPFSVLTLAIWFGLVNGLLELLMLVIRVTVSEKGFFLRSGHFVWMVPVSELTICVGWGLLVAVMARWVCPLSVRSVIGSFVFIACFSQLLMVRGLNSLTCGSSGCRDCHPVSALDRGPHYASRPADAIRDAGPAGHPGPARGLGSLLESLGRRRSEDPRLGQTDRAPNILLIVLDTVRADHLRIYGYDRDTTPNLARLASRGVRFDRAHSAASWTLPSHATMLTGRWPHELSVGRLGWLDATYPTLAEFLRDRGYSTGGFVANQFFCGHESGLSRGFDTYRDFPVTPAEVFRASSLGWFLRERTGRLRDELRSLTGSGSPSIAIDFSRKMLR